jgi:hypothetical protein
MKSQRIKQAHLQTTQADTQTKVCKRVSLPNPITPRQTEGQLVTAPN